MKIIAIRHFGDKTTGKTYEEQVKVKPGDILECKDELANERIRKGFAKKYVEPVVEEVVETTETIEEVEAAEEVVETKSRKRK